MVAIKNKQVLIEKGRTGRIQEARKIALNSLEYSINAVNPKTIVTSRMVLKNDTLEVGGYSFNLNWYRNIYVVGGGKAAGPMAEAIEDVLGEKIAFGTVNVPYGTTTKTSIIALKEASHPIPDQAGVEGARQMLELAKKATAEDLIICLISGGGSSLMPCPRDGVFLHDKQELTFAMLKSGAAINEINAVRKHLSGIKGGWLAKAAYPATVLNLILSDVVGDPLDVIASGPTVADSSTFADAHEVLKKYGL